jgi:DNA-binding transcriptional ArsR family regulator
MDSEIIPLEMMRTQAAVAAKTLGFLSNRHRLVLLCALVEGEKNAGALQAACGLSQSATSQHLARLRKEGVVTVRRYQQQMLYRLQDPAVARLLTALHDIYCPKE